ncbi:hypothetical protein ONS96_013377 [Cadophora gregata f. sp. sojae]|nr:hypothetical protein ONS96_013377 [Cadophora gregata f. sp. sojae]
MSDVEKVFKKANLRRERIVGDSVLGTWGRAWRNWGSVGRGDDKKGKGKEKERRERVRDVEWANACD